MSKVYVFGIGGTGSRVLRSLTMLLAAGVKCKADTFVPIIIDPDAAGGDIERTVQLMKDYSEIRKKLNFDQSVSNQFFRTEIKEIMTNYRLPLANTENCRFDQFISMNDMSKENQALTDILFSKKNLNSDMTVGFRGNPNVGSVVLNQFESSNEFLNFANDFGADDKIFIISSIFGGTGASGFPLLLKTLRTTKRVANQALVNRAHIGAITVLPYFKVKQDDKSSIDSATFISKAKSALAYYERTISRNNMIDHLYYIGDDVQASTYENKDGGAAQKNAAHFIELASALALIDFANCDQPTTVQPREFGIEHDVKEIIFDELCNTSKDLLKRPLTQFELFAKFMDEMSDYLSQPWCRDRALDGTFFNGDFIKNLKRNILSQYQVWLSEMSMQDRAFTPFVLHKDPSKVFDLVKGVKTKSLACLDRNYDLFMRFLNKTGDSSKKGEKEQQFVELFYMATKRLVKEKFNIE